MPAFITPPPHGFTALLPEDAASAVREWQAHLDAGRINAAHRPTPFPAIAANRARTEAIFARRAAALGAPSHDPEGR
jgi:hypothetical protein